MEHPKHLEPPRDRNSSLVRSCLRGLRHSIAPVLIVAVAFALLWHLNERKVAELRVLESASVEDPATQGLRSYCDTLRPGVSLHASLLKTDIPVQQIASLLSEMGNVLDLRKLLPGESYEVITDGQDSLRMLRYRKAPGEIFVVEPIEDGFTVFQENIPLTKVVRKVEGTVDVSLYDAVIASGGDAELAVMLSDVFAWDVDFFTDPRKGDKFSFIVEQYMRGGRPRGYTRVLAAVYSGQEMTRDAYSYQVSDGKAGYFDSQGRSLKRAFLRSPLNYRRISSYFSNSRFHPILKRYRPHHGIDYAANYGTPVVTIGDGVVEYAGWKGGFGRYVSVRHNSTFTSTYGHLSKFGKGVRRGVRVAQGQVIGYVGSSGLSTGPHLDFRLKQNGKYVNFLRIAPPALAAVPKAEMAAFEAHKSGLLQAMSSMAASQTLELAEFEARFFPDSLESGLAMAK
ncbi:MAG: M23 family metallopeptidase [Candidatus Eisenbacteria bacterium]|nr:M23 family metallopeptidase [Candidatus Eisenbacteria bacterium]